MSAKTRFYSRSYQVVGCFLSDILNWSQIKLLLNIPYYSEKPIYAACYQLLALAPALNSLKLCFGNTKGFSGTLTIQLASRQKGESLGHRGPAAWMPSTRNLLYRSFIGTLEWLVNCDVIIRQPNKGTKSRNQQMFVLVMYCVFTSGISEMFI